MLQKQLYDSTLPRAKILSLGVSKDIYLYANKFESSLPSKYKETTLEKVLNCIGYNSIVLFGDFHTHRQSQKEFIRLISQYLDQSKNKVKPIICLECIRSIDNAILKKYVKDEIDEETFLSEIKYDENWGFPWENYRLVFEFARRHDFQVYGINSNHSESDDLKKRDDFIADRLISIRNTFSNQPIFCQIGEFHLGHGHLPARLEREGPGKIDVKRFVLNIDKYYFTGNETKNLDQTCYLKLEEDFFCILNSSPWLKWQSFIVWEEMRHFHLTSIDARENDPNCEISFDIDSQFYTLANIICDYFKVKVSDTYLTDFYIYSVKDSIFSDIDRVKKYVPISKMSKVKKILTNKGYYWNSKGKFLLVNKINMNIISEAAGEFTFHNFIKWPKRLNAQTRFYINVLHTAIACFCSKIINPKRKLVPSNSSFGLEGNVLFSNQLDLVFMHMEDLREGKVKIKALDHKKLYQLDDKTMGNLSNLYGSIVGDLLYSSHLSRKISTTKLMELFNIEDPKFAILQERLIECLRLVERSGKKSKSAG